MLGLLPLSSVPLDHSPSTTYPYGYRRALVVDHTKVSSDQTNFPTLYSVTNASLKATGSGGNVTSSSGYDIIFTSDIAGTNKLDHEIQSYDGTNGIFNAWVRIPLLSSSVDTTIYIWYGNPYVTTSQEAITGVWDSSFAAVYHLGNGTSLSVADSTGVRNGTNSGTATATTGKFDGAASFNGSSKYFNSNYAPTYTTSQDFTIEGWYNTASSGTERLLGNIHSNGTILLVEINNWAGNQIGLWIRESGSVVSQHVESGVTDNNSTWHRFAIKLDHTNHLVKIKVDANTEVTGAYTPTQSVVCANLFVGAYINAASAATSFFTGSLGEIRFSTSLRSTGWTDTAYANESSNTTFWTTGAEAPTNTAALTGVSGTVSPGSVTVTNSEALTGVAGTGSPGTVAATATKALTGETATGSPGTVVAAPSFALTSSGATGSVGTVAPTGTVALTGTSATGGTGVFLVGVSAAVSAGSVTATDTLALTGVAATGSAGSVAAAASFALTGTVGTGSPGTVAPSTSVAVSGNTATGSLGSVVSTPSLALTGQSSTGSVGTLGVTNTEALTGTSATGSVGVFLAGVSAALSAGSVSATGTLALTGVVGTTSVGSVTSAPSLALTGTSAAGSPGTLTPTISPSLSGVSGTGAAGDATPQVPGGAALSGVEGTGQVGTVSVAYTVAVTGNLSTLTAGSLEATSTTAITGPSATGALGSVAVTASRSLTGNLATVSEGLVSHIVSTTLSGVEGDGSVGTTRVGGPGVPVIVYAEVIFRTSFDAGVATFRPSIEYVVQRAHATAHATLREQLPIEVSLAALQSFSAEE